MVDKQKLSLIDADHRRLVRAAARWLGAAEAEDTVQDAYVRMLESDPGAIDAAQAWLSAVVRNLAIDRLRRRQWMESWLAGEELDRTGLMAPSAEALAAMAESASRALRTMALLLTMEEAATVLLHEVFEASHAEIAAASGGSEAGSRQRLKRALARVRTVGDQRGVELDASDELVFRLCLQSLQRRDPQVLWAMLGQPSVEARVSAPTVVAAQADRATASTCGVMQIGGQLGLVLSLDGVQLCVVPLGVWRESDEAVPASC